MKERAGGKDVNGRPEGGKLSDCCGQSFICVGVGVGVCGR